MKRKSLMIAYLFWLFGCGGMLGFHRFYCKKYFTGAIWLCTGGLFMVGALIDLFIMPKHVKDGSNR